MLLILQEEIEERWTRGRQWYKQKDNTGRQTNCGLSGRTTMARCRKCRRSNTAKRHCGDGTLLMYYAFDEWSWITPRYIFSLYYKLIKRGKRRHLLLYVEIRLPGMNPRILYAPLSHVHRINNLVDKTSHTWKKTIPWPQK